MSAGSFTQRLLAELAPHPPPLPCCRAAVIDGMRLTTPEDDISTTRLVAARAALQLLHEGGLDAHVTRVAAARRGRYRIAVSSGELIGPASTRICCSRSRLRGALMARGRINRPDAVPHAEIELASAAAASVLHGDATRLQIPAQIVNRGDRVLLTVRSADGVAALLSSVGAQAGRLEFEEGRVIHEVRGTVNRRLNAETANLRRTVSAGVGQVAAILELQRRPDRWEALPPALREAADLRLRSPSERLEALAVTAGCSRSAMAGRLHRLVALAADA